MKLPNAEHAIITEDKLADCVLAQDHERGGSKARLLFEFGYRRAEWEQLAEDIRKFHLGAEVQSVRETPYGTRYEIRELLETPIGRRLWVRTVWQVDKGT